MIIDNSFNISTTTPPTLYFYYLINHQNWKENFYPIEIYNFVPSICDNYHGDCKMRRRINWYVPLIGSTPFLLFRTNGTAILPRITIPTKNISLETSSLTRGAPLFDLKSVTSVSSIFKSCQTTVIGFDCCLSWHSPFNQSLQLFGQGHLAQDRQSECGANRLLCCRLEFQILQ